MASKHISLPSTFAAGDPTEWFKRFEICCRANEWSDAVKALKLPTLLEGEALAVWMELSEAEKEDYMSAKQKSNDFQNGASEICVTGRLLRGDGYSQVSLCWCSSMC